MNVVVSGMGAVSLLGKSVEEQRKNLFNPHFSTLPFIPNFKRIQESPPHFDTIPLHEEISSYSAHLGIQVSRNSALALAAFEECLRQSSWNLRELSQKRVAFIMGTTAGCTCTNAEYAQNFSLDLGPDPEIYKIALQQNPANVLKTFSKLHSAEVFIINNACTSSTDALGLGAKLLEQNKYDVVFAGGSDEILFQTYFGFGSLQLLSPRFSCSPFDKNRDGLLLSEAAAVLCLERAADFRSRSRDQAQGTILGYESITEAYHQTGPHPDAEGLQEISATLLKKAKREVNDLDFISAHATGTLSNDESEGKFFARHMPGIKIMATKGYTGHCLGAVGALEAIFCFLSFQEKALPRSYGFKEAAPDIGIHPTTEIVSLEKNKSLLAYSTSVGFGGVNSGLLLQGNTP